MLGGIPSVIASVLLSFVVGITYFPFMLILSLCSVVNAGVFGLLNNLKYYRLDWKDETEVVKQGMAVLISLVTAVIPGLIILLGYFVAPINEFIYLAIAAVLFVLYDLVLYKRLMNQGVKKFKNIN